MHDKNGEQLAVGDRVLLECHVTDVMPGAEYCNVTVKTCEPFHPGTEPTSITLNTRQLWKPRMTLETPAAASSAPASAPPAEPPSSEPPTPSPAPEMPASMPPKSEG